MRKAAFYVMKSHVLRRDLPSFREREACGYDLLYYPLKNKQTVNCDYFLHFLYNIHVLFTGNLINFALQKQKTH